MKTIAYFERDESQLLKSDVERTYRSADGTPLPVGFDEETFTLPAGSIDTVEVMVNRNDETVLDVYVYRDTPKDLLDDISETWHPGRNPLFLHASDPDQAWEYIEAYALERA